MFFLVYIIVSTKVKICIGEHEDDPFVLICAIYNRTTILSTRTRTNVAKGVHKQDLFSD